jgi:hypothetical protein
MLKVVENPKPQSRPEFFYISAKLDSFKKEGNIIKPNFEPLVIARPTELIERLLPRFDSSCKKLMGEKTEVKELLDSECDSIIHANSSNDGIADISAIAVSPDCDTISYANSLNDGFINNSNGLISTENGMTNQNTESKFEISKYDIQKERDKFLLKLLCENRERRKSIVKENTNAQDIENKCTLREEKVDGGGGDSSAAIHLDRVWGGGNFCKRHLHYMSGEGTLTLDHHYIWEWGILIHNHLAYSISTLE